MQGAVGRARDFVARYGGEEFACLLPECDAQGALRVGRAILDAVNGLKIPHETSETADNVTVSIGIAAAVPTSDSSAGNLVTAADHQLYRAKLRGRNTIESCQDELKADMPGDA
jgi:diguanylate cyclase (GGDEF)-like protein